jgi:TPR repeat protein
LHVGFAWRRSTASPGDETAHSRDATKKRELQRFGPIASDVAESKLSTRRPALDGFCAIARFSRVADLETTSAISGCGSRAGNRMSPRQQGRPGSHPRGPRKRGAAVADLYLRGEGRPKDPTEAPRWFRRAAEQGNAAAQYNLGTMYANGAGVPRDASQATKCYHAAARQGDTTMRRTNWEGCTGQATAQREIWLAAACSRKAREQGNKLAQFRLGIMYMAREGVEEVASRRTSG